MHDLLTNLDEGLVLPLAGMLVGAIAIVGGFTVAVTKVVSSHYRKSQRDEMEATLKMEMIQRGMSADEIARVLEARMGGDAGQVVAKFISGLPPFKMPAFAKQCEKG